MELSLTAAALSNYQDAGTAYVYIVGRVPARLLGLTMRLTRCFGRMVGEGALPYMRKSGSRRGNQPPSDAGVIWGAIPFEAASAGHGSSPEFATFFISW